MPKGYKRVHQGFTGQRQKKGAYLKRRKRHARSAGLSAKGSVSMDSANSFFKKRYGVSYAEFLSFFNADTMGDKDRITFDPKAPVFLKRRLAPLADVMRKAVEEDRKVLLIFPLSGTLFNFHFVRGMVNELKVAGSNKVSARTIITDVRGMDPYKLGQDTGRLKVVREQAARILRSVRPDFVYFADIKYSGNTANLLKEAFKGCQTFTLNIPLEHQGVAFRDKGTADIEVLPVSSVARKVSRKSIPHKEQSALYGELEAWLNRKKDPTSGQKKTFTYDSLEFPERNLRYVPLIREMCFYAGRFFFRLNYAGLVK